MVPAPASDPSANRLPGGVVSDVSYTGVSTQYLVKSPWGQELSVFEQNHDSERRFAPGDRVDLTWAPSHTFLLDAAQDASAGVETEL
jgi:spermidine/putrescine transport system ATP-binding protein